MLLLLLCLLLPVLPLQLLKGARLQLLCCWVSKSVLGAHVTC